MTNDPEVTLVDLTEAYRKTGLRRLGYTLLQALEEPALSIVLTRVAKNALKTRATGEPAPDPLALTRNRYVD